MAVTQSAGNGEELISIGRLASETGVSSRTIRYYEELGILPEPPRSAGGTRKYPAEYRFYIEGALALKELGFTLEEIKLLGRMALGRPMSERQRTQAAEIVLDRMTSLEHKIRVLSRLREILNEYGTGNDPVDPQDRVAHLVGLLGESR
ncbi:MAG: MerR family DNA-binding transcriptional regulator [Acidimicrobiia bacterium]